MDVVHEYLETGTIKGYRVIRIPDNHVSSYFFTFKWDGVKWRKEIKLSHYIEGNHHFICGIDKDKKVFLAGREWFSEEVEMTARDILGTQSRGRR